MDLIFTGVTRICQGVDVPTGLGREAAREAREASDEKSWNALFEKSWNALFESKMMDIYSS